MISKIITLDIVDPIPQRGKDIINKLNSQLVSILNNPEIKSQLNSKGFDVISSSPEQLGEYIKSEVSKWAPIVKKSGATAD